MTSANSSEVSSGINLIVPPTHFETWEQWSTICPAVSVPNVSRASATISLIQHGEAQEGIYGFTSDEVYLKCATSHTPAAAGHFWRN